MADCPTSSLNPDKCERVTFRRHFRTRSREQVRFPYRPVGRENDRGFQISLRDNLKQRGGGLVGQRQIAQLLSQEST